MIFANYFLIHCKTRLYPTMQRCRIPVIGSPLELKQSQNNTTAFFRAGLLLFDSPAGGPARFSTVHVFRLYGDPEVLYTASGFVLYFIGKHMEEVWRMIFLLK